MRQKDIHPEVEEENSKSEKKKLHYFSPKIIVNDEY